MVKTFIDVRDNSLTEFHYDEDHGATDHYELNEKRFYNNVIKLCIKKCREQTDYMNTVGVTDCIEALGKLLIEEDDEE